MARGKIRGRKGVCDFDFAKDIYIYIYCIH